MTKAEELALRETMCEIGHRVWQREYVAANDGNFSVRLDDDTFLCTPTMVSKGFMKPDDLAIVNLDGNQLSGPLPCTSEVKMHIMLMKQDPDVKAVLHVHPPHATAFCVARQILPKAVLPEIELFLKDIPMIPYENPGTQAFADCIIDFPIKSNAYLLANHGALTLGKTLPECYYRMEMVDQYCRILILAKQLTDDWSRIDPDKLGELRAMRDKLTKTIPDK